MAVAAMAPDLGAAGPAVEANGYASRPRGALYSLRASDDDPAREKEVIGINPYRSGPLPAEPRVDGSIRALVDPKEFWMPLPVASAARSVPVLTPHAQEWPGPAVIVTPCRWHGPTWPHANSLVVDAMTKVERIWQTPPRAVGDAPLGMSLVGVLGVR